jgi:hypothetical protein
VKEEEEENKEYEINDLLLDCALCGENKVDAGLSTLKWC